MFSSFKKLFGAEPVRETVTIKGGQMFAWRSGIRFQAIEDSEIIFPGEIFREGEELGSVIEADDDADIGFHKRPEKICVPILLPDGIAKDDVPIGTEVILLEDEHEIVKTPDA